MGASLPQRPQRTWRTRLKRILLMSMSVALLLLLLLDTLDTWFVRRTLPQTSGTILAAGLQHPVSVERDQWGVPHITASTLHDALFAQGYVTAQDRLFQMELNRCIAQGRLAETFGAGVNNKFLDADILLRTLGLYHVAQTQVAHADVATRALLQAYADGVNAFLTTHKGDLPLEFTLLGITPAPWTPADVLAAGTTITLSLDSAWYYKYTRALLQMKVGKDIANELFPAYPAENPTLLTFSTPTITPKPTTHSSPSTSDFATLPPDLLRGVAAIHALLGSTSASFGSNDWVVDGTRTVSGKPLLANDPHLDISMPATWYEIALCGPGLDVIGFSLPGTPGVLIGHNDHIAWGVTNVEADGTDLYRETLDPVHHPGQYFYNNYWLPLQIRRETISMRNESKPLTITIAATIDGPILNSAVSDLKRFTPVSLKWTLLQPGYTLAGFMQLDFATNWSQFLAALANISISQNFVYADTEGNIGYRMSGKLPIRPLANSQLPVDGSTSTFEWQGYVPQEEMPTLFNPPTHVIVTANNQIVPNTYPFYVTAYWDQGYRAHRMGDLLAVTPRLSVADFERTQADVYSIPAAKITPYFITAGRSASGDAAEVAKLLKGWNDTMTQESTAASLYEVTAGILLRETLESLLGKQLYTIYTSNYLSSGLFSLLINLLTKPAAPFFGITSQNQANASAKRDTAIVHALTEAMNQLRAQFGPSPSQWSWGRLHQAHFEHPLASVTPLNLILGVSPLERPGDSVTVNIGGDDGFSADPPNYDQVTVSSMREIIDLSNLDNSLWIITTGESGQPFSAYYSDLTSLWDQNQYQRMDFSPQAEDKAIKERLTLKPSYCFVLQRRSEKRRCR